jgi:hypothetical protein
MYLKRSRGSASDEPCASEVRYEIRYALSVVLVSMRRATPF